MPDSQPTAEQTQTPGGGAVPREPHKLEQAGSTPAPATTLGQKQRAFTRLLAMLILHVYDRGCELTLADGNVDPIRKGRLLGASSSAPKLQFRDAVHMEGSLHYSRLAQDLNLFVGGEWITDGGHPVWTEIGVWWEAQHSLARWGGRWGDANHLSLEHEGRA